MRAQLSSRITFTFVCPVVVRVVRRIACTALQAGELRSLRSLFMMYCQYMCVHIVGWVGEVRLGWRSG